jgi:hypothetical protein
MVGFQKIELSVKELSFHKKEEIRLIVGHELLESSNCLRVAHPLTVP